MCSPRGSELPIKSQEDLQITNYVCVSSTALSSKDWTGERISPGDHGLHKIKIYITVQYITFEIFLLF